MKLRMGTQLFEDVTIPLLWGTRAVLQDRSARLSIIDLQGERARVEIVGDVPGPGVEYRPTVDGFVIIVGATDVYHFEPVRHRVTPIALELPECEVTSDRTRVGNAEFSNNTIAGFGVGIMVTPGGGLAVGAPLPSGLAPLEVA